MLLLLRIGGSRASSGRMPWIARTRRTMLLRVDHGHRSGHVAVSVIGSVRMAAARAGQGGGWRVLRGRCRGGTRCKEARHRDRSRYAFCDIRFAIFVIVLKGRVAFSSDARSAIFVPRYIVWNIWSGEITLRPLHVPWVVLPIIGVHVGATYY